ncbi:MAG: DUF72 domain-containing protein [Candidatus Rokubacteria bacterium]|nr:DUF72 domain-containing protein [Candidatus Rokubacteria bacterium]
MARGQRGRVLIGTSGYVYGDWRGRFYPQALPARQWLSFYAARFPTVELNNSFYRLPSAAMFRAWRKAVDADYVFAVKASRFLTHLKRLKDARGPLDVFLARARHLGPTLGPVLFQLPRQFHANAGRLDDFLRVLDRQRRVANLRAVLEVRHPSWLEPSILERLERAGVALCIHDSKAQPVTGPITADFVYVRRHGYGRRGSYTRRALERDAAAIRRWRAQGLDVYVYFNNDWRAFAIRNALALAQLARGSAGRRSGLRTGAAYTAGVPKVPAPAAA